MFEFLIRRLLLAVFTIFAASIISFAVIQLPPGDWITTYASRLSEQGDEASKVVLNTLREYYGLGDPLHIQYAKWIWGILQGRWGQSMEWGVPVEQLIGERLALTVLLSAVTITFVWIVAIPIGVYSAIHKYSLLDYVFTFFGFLGLATPDFLMALVLMWIGFAYFGQDVGGLFSPEFQNAPWSLAKVLDLLQHMWIPVIVVGMSGTAGLIRTLRANVLDELNQPYVETARAKGLGESKLIWKYPVRVALNPFVSTIGYALPQLISGIVITAVVLSLPTIGPVYLRALQSQDMYLAGAILLIISILTVVGTLLSDILLAIIDPRIKLE
jgi:peptide/nickel transport system permease protein